MASIINAASSGSGGLVSTADSSGVLQLQTNGTTAMTVATSGYVGIGTTSPSTPLDIFNNTQTTTPASRFYINANGTTPSNLQGFAIYNNVSGGFVDTTLVAGNTTNTYMAFGIHNGTSYSERARIDPNGNLVIGATSATAKLDVYNGQGTQLRVRGTSTRTSSSVLGAFEDDTNGGKGSWGSNAYAGSQYSNALTRYQSDISGWGIIGNNYVSTYTANDALLFSYVSTAGTTTEYARIDYQGNFGLGVTPSAYSSGTKAIDIGAYGVGIANTAGYQATFANNAYYNSGWLYKATGYQAALYSQNSGAHSWSIAGSGTAGNAISFTQAMTLDNSGNLLVGTTSSNGRITSDGTSNSSNQAVWAKNIDATGTAATYVAWNAATTGNPLFVDFYTETSATRRGTISYNRAGGLVAYNVTSDYRAKDIYGPVTGSGALIDSVPVYMGKMKGATQERPMFIAHETPDYAHTGEKDAVDKDGKPVYQQMDASALIPVMWAEIQSLRSRLKAANIA